MDWTYLGKMSEDWWSRNRFHTLEFSRSIHEKLANQDIDDRDDHHGDSKRRKDKRDQYDDRERIQRLLKEPSKVIRDRRVDGFEVLGETIKNSANRGSIFERAKRNQYNNAKQGIEVAAVVADAVSGVYLPKNRRGARNTRRSNSTYNALLALSEPQYTRAKRAPLKKICMLVIRM